MMKQLNNQNTNTLMIGKVVSTSPLAIELNGQIISKYIYMNSSLTVLSEDLNDIQTAFKDRLNIQGGEISGTYDISSEWLDFLLEYHEKSVIKKDDIVVIMQNSTSFYILEKVVLV